MTQQQGHQAGFIFVERQSVNHVEVTWWEEDGIHYGISKCWYPPKIAGLQSVWHRRYRRLFREYVDKFGKPDLIHAHSFVAGMAARDLSGRYHLPYLITEHSTALPARRVPWHHRQGLRQAYHAASALIAVSQFLKAAMQQYCSGCQIRVIGNPVDFSRFIPAGSRSSSVRLIWIGSLEPRKNLSLLLHALHQLSDTDITLSVIGTGSLEDSLRREAKALDIAGRIEWFGNLPSDRVAQELAHAQIYISTSTLETFGVAIVEALACGIPVIATKSGGPEEFINTGIGKLVASGDVNALANAIRTMLAAREQDDRERIRSKAERLFSFPVIGSQLDQVYGDVLG